jgi:exonuclease III
MKILIWNIRGIGKPARVRQLKEMILQEQVEVVGIQETIKQSFSRTDLLKINPRGDFCWEWLPARGHSGGILLGVKEDNFQVENWEHGAYYQGVTIRDRKSNFRWDLIIVYGPAQHNYSREFLEELDNRCDRAFLPLVIGGISIW